MGSKKRHILVVEDEDHLAVGLKYNLEAEGFRVTHVGDGPAALRLLEEAVETIDLVVLDLMLPGMSGYAVCERMRGSNLNMPVLILSARTLAEDRTRGFEVGADQYMMKPFDLDELISRVKNLLATYDRRNQQAAHETTPRATSYEFANAHVNFETFVVMIADQAVRLTQLEMQLLQYFIDNAGRVIPRAELLENIWNLPPTANTRAPDQFIRRLRKIFEPEPAKPRHFLTIRDVGYRFLPSGEE